MQLRFGRPHATPCECRCTSGCSGLHGLVFMASHSHSSRSCPLVKQEWRMCPRRPDPKWPHIKNALLSRLCCLGSTTSATLTQHRENKHESDRHCLQLSYNRDWERRSCPSVKQCVIDDLAPTGATHQERTAATALLPAAVLYSRLGTLVATRPLIEKDMPSQLCCLEAPGLAKALYGDHAIP